MTTTQISVYASREHSSQTRDLVLAAQNEWHISTESVNAYSTTSKRAKECAKDARQKGMDQNAENQ